MHWISLFQTLCEHFFSSALTLCPLISYYHSCHVLCTSNVVSVLYVSHDSLNLPRRARCTRVSTLKGCGSRLRSTACTIHMHSSSWRRWQSVMKPTSTLLSLALLFSILKCRGNRTERSIRSDMYNNEVDIGSEEFQSKWLGNVSDVQLRAEWSSWKTTHRKKYSTSVQDLERYVVWRSNKAYINYHNSFASNFGFYLSMNKFGDLVSPHTNPPQTLL